MGTWDYESIAKEEETAPFVGFILQRRSFTDEGV